MGFDFKRVGFAAERWGKKRQKVSLSYRLDRTAIQGSGKVFGFFFNSAGPFALSNFSRISLASENRFSFAADASVVGLKSNKKYILVQYKRNWIQANCNLIMGMLEVGLCEHDISKQFSIC